MKTDEDKILDILKAHIKEEVEANDCNVHRLKLLVDAMLAVKPAMYEGFMRVLDKNCPC